MITVLSAGDPQRQKLDAIQAQIAELTSQRQAITGADVPLDELRERCAQKARDLLAGGRGEAAVRHLAKPPRPPALIQRDDTARDLGALMVYLLGEQTIADRLFERASTQARYAPGLPTSERASRAAELDAALREQLIAEEREARRLEAAGGVFVMRRSLAELDVDAILDAWDQVT